MDRMPFYLMVFQSVPETAILISLGLALLGFKPKLKSVLVIASLESFASFLIRSLPLPPGGNKAFEAVEPLAADKRTVALRIFETGKHFVFQTVNPCFIEKELRNKIFEPGFSTKAGNRGFGLASVKSVVEKNRGKILVSSFKDRGTKFTVLFPRQQRGW